MDYSTATSKFQEQAISALESAQDSFISLAKPIVSVAEPFYKLGAKLPFAEQLPSPKGAVEQWYGFAADALQAQKNFSLSLAGLFSGDGKATSAAARPRAKTA